MKLKARICDAPSNSFRDPNVGPIMKQWKKKIETQYLTHNTLKIGECARAQDGTRMNSQARVQNDINLHNQRKRAVNANSMQKT
jgi:hypothetical protein